MIDDVYIHASKSDKWYKSVAAYETLVELQKECIITFTLFHKRLSDEYNQKWNQKYVALVQRI